MSANLKDHFPACDWLGYSLDMTTPAPLDVKSVMVATKKAHQIIKYDLDKDTRTVILGGTKYNTPKCIRVNDYNIVDKDYITHADAYLASLTDYASRLNETALWKRLEEMPEFDGRNYQSYIAEWKDFFALFGSHVIIDVSYGTRFKLTGVRAENENKSVNKTCSTGVDSEFNRILSTGARNLPLGSFNVVEIWVLMKDAAEKKLRDGANKVKRAYKLIVTTYITAVFFDIQSDWGEFNLLSSNATIMEDKGNPGGTVASESGAQIQWSKAGNRDIKTLRFFVINDGSPIDFSISHGSDFCSKGYGKAEVTLDSGVSYVSNGVIDNKRTTTWFYRKKISHGKSTAPFSLVVRMVYCILHICGGSTSCWLQILWPKSL